MEALDELTAAKLKERTGISLPYASQILRGQRTPSLKMAQKLEREAGVPTSFWPRPKIEPVKRDSAA